MSFGSHDKLCYQSAADMVTNPNGITRMAESLRVYDSRFSGWELALADTETVARAVQRIRDRTPATVKLEAFDETVCGWSRFLVPDQETDALEAAVNNEALRALWRSVELFESADADFSGARIRAEAYPLITPLRLNV